MKGGLQQFEDCEKFEISISWNLTGYVSIIRFPTRVVSNKEKKTVQNTRKGEENASGNQENSRFPFAAATGSKPRARSLIFEI